MQSAECIRLRPAILKRKHLSDELGVHEAARPGFDGQFGLPGRRALLFDALAHPGDLLLPIRRIGRESPSQRLFHWPSFASFPQSSGQCKVSSHIRRTEVSQGRSERAKLFAERHVPRHRPGARQGLYLPQLGALPVIVLVSSECINEEPFLSIRTQSRVRRESNAQLGRAGKEIHQVNGQPLEL